MTDGDDAYVMVDCPGQIELYSHLPVSLEEERGRETLIDDRRLDGDD